MLPDAVGFAYRHLPYRRCHVPADLDEVTTVRPGAEVDPQSVDVDDAAIDAIWERVTRLYRSGAHPAIALCVRRYGEVIIDRAIGHSHGNGPDDDRDGPKTVATPDTPFCLFSTSKAYVAMLVHLFDQRGELHIADRVAEYFPEFAANGKESITIAHILAHRAGIPLLPEDVFDLSRLSDRDFIVDVMVNARPLNYPGRRVAYHALSGGWVLAEVLERVTGRDLQTLLNDEICEPLGLRATSYGVNDEDVDLVAKNYVTGMPLLPPLSTLFNRALGAPIPRLVELSNQPEFLTAIVPAGNVITTADEACLFFDLLRAGGEVDGVQIFEPKTIRRAVVEQSYLELDWSMGFPFRYGLGFHLGVKTASLYGPDTDRAFGHLGFTNIICWADPEREVSGALLTSGKPVLYPEVFHLWDAIRHVGLAAPKVEISTLDID